MASFLYQTAQYINESYRDRLSEIAVILPNRRAGLFLRKYLAGMLPGTSWSPALFSIEEFLTSLSGLKELDQVHCLIDLYRVHQTVEGEKAQSFDEFLNWGAQLLSDFNEIDRYLVDPSALFTYLDEVRAITVWNPGNTSLTEFQINYLKFYHSLLAYYNGLTGMILARGEAYQGLIFRNAWQRLESGQGQIAYKKVVFAGFNALTKSEEWIIDRIVKQGVGELLWDSDSYYMEDTKQEAGEYLRRWFNKWPEWSGTWKFNDFKTGGKRIHVVAVPDLTGQVKLAGNLLGDWQCKGEINEHDAVVLPDERLLLPLLNSLPEGSAPVNITMGLPLSQTPLADLLGRVFEMHLHAVKMASGQKKTGKFHFRDVISVLQHPYVTRLALSSTDGNRFAFRELIAHLQTGQKRFLLREDLILDNAGLFSVNLGFLDLVFSPWASLDEVLTGLQGLVDATVVHTQGSTTGTSEQDNETAPRIEREYAYAIARILRQLRLLNEISANFLTWDSLEKFLRQLLDTTKLPFYGEPLKGLQIMGMLETRTLDFNRVIILSCNEGILPSGRNQQSFIPFDVRKDFGLPLYREKDAVYAYHFYRLLQHASEVWLMYDSEPGPLGGGDPSRFIRQIEAELPGYNKEIGIQTDWLVTPMLPGREPVNIEIAKETPVMEILMEKAKEGMSPTSLNAFRTCSLRFYFAEIAGLKEPEDQEGEIDPKTLGSAVHHALMKLYTPLIRKVLTDRELSQMELKAGEAVHDAFLKVFEGNDTTTGKNLLLVEVARIMVQKFIRWEKNQVENLAGQGKTVVVELLEEHLSRTLAITLEGVVKEIRIKGFVDRVDRVEGVTRVIDYKTGKVLKKEVTVSEWEDLISDSSLDKGFQLLTYTWLLSGINAANLYHAGIYTLKNQASGFISVTLPGEKASGRPALIGKPEILKMENILVRILSDIFDPDQPFVQTRDEERCLFCPYRSICGR